MLTRRGNGRIRSPFFFYRICHWRYLHLYLYSLLFHSCHCV